MKRHDLVQDPFETADLALDPAQRTTPARCAAALRAILDPAAGTAPAFAGQEARIAAFGGGEQVLRLGNYPYTPAPGEDPRFADDLALG